MTQPQIEEEVRRLAPWYYLYDFHGVRTDIAPSFDSWGHRTVDIPPEVTPHLAGKTILDVGCNEGGYAFAALRKGAKRVLGFDCRPINVEKANFAARALGIENAVFQVGSVDTWTTEEVYDVVFLCGLLYHLPEPWKAIKKFSAIAREGVFVTTMLRGGCDGYSPWSEGESIGASEDPRLASLTPNTIRTVVTEFEKHGFTATYIAEYYYFDLAPLAFFGRRLGRRLRRTRLAFINEKDMFCSFSHRLNRARVRALNKFDPLVRWIRGYPRYYCDDAPSGIPDTGRASLFFRRKINVA
jgi:SAM-dependent methyltransferase